MEVFPVKIAIKGEVIWFGWVSPEDGSDFFLTNNGCLIFSCDGKDELMREVMAVFPDAQMEIESFFDLDSAVGVAGRGAVLEGDLALDIWNLLTDLHHTFGGGGTMFLESHREVYSRLFSQSEVASWVDVQRVQLSARDIEVVREVLLEGIELFAQKIRIAKIARSQA